MSNDKKPKNTKFNAYWIYGIAIVLFLAFNVFSGGLGDSSGALQHLRNFLNTLRNGDVKKVEIVNKREALVYLTTKALIKTVHKKTKKEQLFPSGIRRS